VLFIGILPVLVHAQKRKKNKQKKEDLTLIDQGNQQSMTDLEGADTTIVAPEEKHITLYKEGLKLIDSSKYDKAILEFKKSLKLKNDYYQSWLKMGYCKMMLEDHKGADKDFIKAQETGPNDFETLKLVGINFFLMKDYKNSKGFLDSAQLAYENEKIDDAEYHYYRGKLMFVGKSYKTALEESNIALEVNPKYYDAMILKCEIRFAQKEHAYALRELNETIKVLPEAKKDYNLYKMRAQTKFELKDYKGSVSDWSVYIDANSKDEEARISRAMARININDFTNAVVDLDEAIKMNPKNPVSWCYRGLAKGSNKQVVEGIKDLDYSIKLKFDYSTAYVNRAALKMASKDKRGACDDLQKADSLGNAMAPQLFEQYCK
jgi:tetratricopeptide (TPR) repeat protein